MEYELYHYGVKGMKWGVRRYRNADGTLTPEAKRQARKEYRDDNKTAFELGKSATLTGYATAKSMKRTIGLENKLEKQYEKDPEGMTRRTRSLKEKWQASAKTTSDLAQRSAELQSKAEAHCKSLIDKYGKDAVSTITYKDHKLPAGKHSPGRVRTMNENTTSISESAVAGGITATTTVLNLLGVSPVAVITIPRSTSSKARRIEMDAYNRNRIAQRNAARNTRT
jgi:hypothetical protein